MSVRPEFLDHLRRQISSEIEDAIRRDHQKLVDFIDKKIDKLKDEAHDVDMGGGDSLQVRAIISALNDVRVKLF